MASLGGHRITRIRSTGLAAITVEVESPYTDKIFQLYAGRSLVGKTPTVGLYSITGQIADTLCPTPIAVVMVDLVDRDTEYGHLLPRRPWNRYRAAWAATSFPADARWFSIHGSPAAGESIDYESPLLRIPFAGDGAYEADLPEITGCGEWSYAIVPRDDALPDGNGGTPAEMSVQAIVFPPDVLVNDLDQRMSVVVADGIATVEFQYNWPA